jgi:hypothetical protein
MLDKFRSRWVNISSPIPFVLACDALAIEPHSPHRDVPVTKEDYGPAGEVGVAVLRVVEGPPSDDDEWTEPGSAARLQRMTGNLTLQTFEYHFVYCLMPLQHALRPLVLHLHAMANGKDAEGTNAVSELVEKLANES